MIPKNCRRCGLCCMLAVRLTDREIRQIRRLGYDDDYFLERDATGKTILKLANGYCIFLKLDEGVAKCRIYGYRPRKCRDYPGKDECTLMRHYRIVEMEKI